MRALFIAALLAGAAAAPAAAEIDADRMKAAHAAIEQYAREMSDFLPCAYIGYADSKGDADLAETTYGVTAVTGIIGKFIGDGDGTLAEAAELAADYAANARPVFDRDIRELARFCRDRKFLEQMYRLSGAAVPLNLRPPFNGP
ncbi:MAG TPA: hypothetical protein VFB16_15965 [Bauldia sp.]|nr:hypothetical protein [Bauldia sp.]